MGNTNLYKALFMLGRFATSKTSTTNSFFAMAYSSFSSNPTLVIFEVMKTSTFNSLIVLACFLVSLDPGLSYRKNIEDNILLYLTIEIKNMDILEYILRSLPRNIS